MGIAERREREREEVRRKILDAARDLFASEGYERVTMRAIAEAIEYSPTTIYNHFEDKQDVVQSLCDEDFGRLLGALHVHELPADPLQRIRQLGLAYARFGIEQPNHYRFMFMTPKIEEGHELSQAGLQAFELVRSAVREAVESGAVPPRDVDTLAQVLWASLHGAVALLVTLPSDRFPCTPAVPDLVEQVVDNSLRGLLAAEAEAR